MLDSAYSDKYSLSRLCFFVAIFLCCLSAISVKSQSISDNDIKRYEELFSQNNKLDSKQKRKIVKLLRSYYLSRNDQNKLLWLNQQIARSSDIQGRNKELFDSLLELENISLQLTGLPGKAEKERLKILIAKLHEFRWGERDLARALSYIAIGRAYFLLGEYEKALNEAMCDPQLFSALDKKFAVAKDKGSSPLGSLLFLMGNCNQALVETASEKKLKTACLGKALISYYTIVKDYDQSTIAADALSRYNQCRREIQELTGASIVSINLKRKSINSGHTLPSNISMLMKTGNYGKAAELLKHELKSQSTISPIIATALAVCYAHGSKDTDCIKILKQLIKQQSKYLRLPNTMLQCAAILRQNGQHRSTEEIYRLVLEKYKDSESSKTAAFALAVYAVQKLRAQSHSGKAVKDKDIKSAINLYDLSEAGSSSGCRFHIIQGKAELYFLAKRYNEAAKEYKKLLKFSGMGTDMKKESALNYARALYFQATVKSPASVKLLDEAKNMLISHKLTDIGNKDNFTEAGSYLLAEIYDKQNKLSKAAKWFSIVAELSGVPENSTNCMLRAATLYSAANDFVKANKLLDRISKEYSRDSVNLRLRMAKELLAKKQNRQAFSLMTKAMSDNKKLSQLQLQWILESCYNVTGDYAQQGWYLALKAGRILTGSENVQKNLKLANLIRLKTAQAAMKLKNYPTALANVDMVIDSDETSLWMSARFIKADILTSLHDELGANRVLTETALMASKVGDRSLFLTAKYKIGKNKLSLGDHTGAKAIADNLLLPLNHRQKSRTPENIPDVYEDIIFVAFQASNQQEKAHYATMYKNFFPDGKLELLTKFNSK